MENKHGSGPALPLSLTPLPLLQSSLRECRRCVDAGFLLSANPLVLGDSGARFLVIGQAPSRTDHETGDFYTGPAGKKLRGWLADAGFSDDDLSRDVYFSAITRCFPGRKPGSSTDRLPSRAEQKLCRSWLDSEIATVNPRALILFGGLAIKTFLSDAPLAELVGRTFDGHDGRAIVPLPHSSGASTWLNSPEHRALLREAIGQLATLRKESR